MKKAIRKRVVKKKPVKKELPELILKGVRVEYFDDRFYKVSLPQDIDKLWIQNVPENLIDDDGEFKHVYLVSVTTVQNNSEPRPFIENWKGQVGLAEAERVSNLALWKGSVIHNACDKYCNGFAIIYRNEKLDDPTEKEIKQFQKKNKCHVHLVYDQEHMLQVARLSKILNSLDPEIVATEQAVYSLSEVYAGTVDAEWRFAKDISIHLNSKRTKIEIPKGDWIIDYKTGKNYDEKNCYTQLAAYLHAHHNFEKLTGGIGIHLNHDRKSGIDGFKLYVKTKEDLQRYYDHFIDLKKVFMFSNPVVPKCFEFPKILLREKINNESKPKGKDKRRSKKKN